MGVREIDGHDHMQIESALSVLPFDQGRPSFLIAHTVKGKGVKSMEDTVDCHYKCVPDDGQSAAYKELGVAYEIDL